MISGTPKLVVEGTGTIDFGRYPAREQKAAVFILANRGDAPLVIAHVRKSCGCATAELAAKTLAPGATAELKTAILGNHVTGSYRKNFYLESNAPGHPDPLR